MKTRSGFVSNSSSASFVVRWKLNFDDEERGSVNSALALLFEIPFGEYLEESDSFNGTSTLYEDCKAVVREIAKNTEKIAKNEYESTFFTSMVNTPMDFGQAAAALTLALSVRKNECFETVSAKVEYE